jgi:hypothetical protein
LAKWFQRRRFLKIGQSLRNKNYLWRPCLLMDRDKMCKLYRGLSIDVSYHTLKVRVGERGNKHFFNCSPINILLFYLKKRSKIDSIV